MAKKKSRFLKIKLEEKLFSLTQILIDKETGVNYLFYVDSATNCGDGSGLTPLLDKDGKIVITPPEELAKLEQE